MEKGAGLGKEEEFSLGQAVESKVPVGRPGGGASKLVELQNDFY